MTTTDEAVPKIRASTALSLAVGEQINVQRDFHLPTHKVLQGSGICLRPIRAAADSIRLFPKTHGSEEIESLWTYLPYGPFSGPTDMRHWLESCSDSQEPHFMAVADAKSDRAVGVVSFLRGKPAMRIIEIGHVWYLPERQQTATNTEAVYLLLTEAFEHLGARRVEWKCDALNQRSRRAALRLGFTFEGIFRQHMIIKSRNRDTAWYAMLDQDWPGIKERIEQWLDADQSKVSLSELNLERG